MSAPASPFRVQVSRSRRRKRSVGAKLTGDLLDITLPWWMNAAEEDHWVEVMSRRFARRLATDRVDLPERAARLAARYGLHRPSRITWAGELRSRWGSCTASTGEIRLSSKLAGFPDWVIDYVIVHELAHLHVRGHNARFWELVQRYPKSERAIGYLIAKSSDDEAPPPDAEQCPDEVAEDPSPTGFDVAGG